MPGLHRFCTATGPCTTLHLGTEARLLAYTDAQGTGAVPAAPVKHDRLTACLQLFKGVLNTEQVSHKLQVPVTDDWLVHNVSLCLT